MPTPIEILVCDDHDLVRAGIRTTLADEKDLRVVGEARDGSEAVALAERMKPDLVVMDVRMPVMDGIEACREVRSQVPETNVLMLTSYSDERAVLSALVAGASGFLLKDVRTADLVDAIRTVGRGGSTLDSSSAEAIVEQIHKGNIITEEERLVGQLTERELETLDLI